MPQLLNKFSALS